MAATRDELLALINIGMTAEEMACRYGVCRITIMRWRRACGLHGIAQRRKSLYIDHDYLAELVEEGLTQAQIARRVGCSIRPVGKNLRAAGLKTRGRHNRNKPVVSGAPSRRAIEMATWFRT